MENLQTIKQRFGIIGNDVQLNRALEKAVRVAPTDISVLVTGESGVGKENIPKIIHQLSHRKHAKYIAVNCGAIPEGTIDSELFGHEKGSFTGAAGRSLGRFEQANQGTLFLDEIGDMPLETQTRLLRVLSEGTFYRIGSIHPVSVDVRIVAATHQNLLKKVELGEFREDLYHRLNVIPLELPPLRERADDIGLLSDFFLAKIAQELNEPKIQISEQALEKMKQFDWPGNVRQLENTCRWLSVMANSQYITPADLPHELSNNNKRTPENQWHKSLANHIKNRFIDGDSNILCGIQEEIEQLLIKTALELSAGKKAEAAGLLGWGRNTLTRKQKE